MPLKPIFGIENQNQGPILVWVIRAKPLIPETDPFFQFFFQIFLLFSLEFFTTIFKLENEPKSSKLIKNYLIFHSKFGFRGPYMMQKTPCPIGN